MSLILEALRKSEAERQRGRLPALATGAAPTPPSRNSPATGWKWSLLGAGTLALILAAWLVGAGWTRRDAATARAVLPATAPASTPAPASMAATAADRPARATALPPIDRLTPPAARVATAQETHDPTHALARNDVAPARDAAAMATTTAPGQQATVAVGARAPAASAPASSVASPATVPAPMPPAAPGAILSLADLDPATRKALPPLQVSMHLWDADPSRRFVILDGDRRAEGDRVGPAVISAITRDGVMLEWNGRRIRVPLR